MNRYELKAGGFCPTNKRRDLFDVVIESERTIPVEDIDRVVAGLDKMKVYQEQWTRLLAERLGAQVTTVGWHSGVRVTVTER